MCWIDSGSSRVFSSSPVISCLNAVNPGTKIANFSNFTGVGL
jgi:hypothetical protein